MVRLTKLKLKSKKKGQLFLLEVFIALSVLVLLMIALYQVEFTSLPTYQDDLSDIGYETLDSLNQAGSLKPQVYNLLTTELADSIETALPPNIYWRLAVEDETGATIFNLFWDRTPPTDASVGVTEYFLFGYETNLNEYRVLHFELWRLVG